MTKHSLFILLFLLVGCENLFHEEDIPIGKIQNYDQLLIATGGAYGKFVSVFDDIPAHYAYTKGDDINNSPPTYSGLYNMTEMIGCWQEYQYEIKTNLEWDNFYSVLASVNNILDQYSLFPEEKPTRIILGELFLIRAYCHFRLTRIYGQIPLIADNDVSYTVEKPSFSEIYEFIRSDLQKAMLLLPENNIVSRIPYETPHRGVAKAILAEVYLSWAGYPANDGSKYELSMETAGEIIDSADYFGFGLLEDFSWVWDKDHLYNKESVFSLYHANPEYSSNLNEVNLDYVGFFYNLDWYGWSFMLNPDEYLRIFYPCAEMNFYNTYPSGYRKEISFFNSIYFPPDFDTSDTGYVHIDQIDPCNRIGIRKFYYDPYIISYDIFYPNNTWFKNTYFYFGSTRTYLFRYAHTLLTYAEASARSGQLNEKSYECVNRIRRRAHNVDLYSSSVYDLQPGLSPEVFADSVVWERAWELCGEPEGRWFDLVRLEMVEDLPNLRHPNEGGPPETFDKSAYFFPIPEGDIRLNPNLGN